MTQQDVIAQLVACDFSEPQAKLGIRANFVCEYCRIDLLENVNIYDTWEWDHIVPSGPDDLSNGALACRLCNKIKKDFRPAKPIQETGREAYIAEIRTFLAQGRKKKSEKLSAIRTIAAYLRQGGGSGA